MSDGQSACYLMIKLYNLWYNIMLKTTYLARHRIPDFADAVGCLSQLNVRWAGCSDAGETLLCLL